MTTDTVATVADLSEDVREALRRFVVALADTKRLLGIRYSDWLLGAPSIESGIAASSMAQDEWGHARLLYAMLKDFGIDPVEVEHQRPASEYCSASCLDEPFTDWAAVVAAIVVVDGALSAALDGFASGSYEPARNRVPKMLAEEAFHRDLGHAWLKALGEGSEEARTRLDAAVGTMLPAAVSCLLPNDESATLLADAGITSHPTDLRARLADRLGRAGIETSMDEPMPHDWDAKRGRSAGEPGEEAVERARGDRNRELFVE